MTDLKHSVEQFFKAFGQTINNLMSEIRRRREANKGEIKGVEKPSERPQSGGEVPPPERPESEQPRHGPRRQ